MEIKGAAVGSIPLFVKNKFPKRYDEWLNSLSQASREIMNDSILIGSWYPLSDACVEPTEKICKLFYNDKIDGAWEGGRFSADFSLKGVYKVFVKVASPIFIMSRASIIFSAYYKPSIMKLVDKSSKKGIIHILKFPEPDTYVDFRIGGWIERALEICGCKDVKITITKSLAKGDRLTEIVGEWK